MGTPNTVSLTIPFTVGGITTRDGHKPAFGLTLGSTQRALLSEVNRGGTHTGGYDVYIEGVSGFKRVSSTAAAVSFLEQKGCTVP